MIKLVLRKVFGSQNERELKKLFPLVAKINALESSIQILTNDQLKAKTFEFKDRLTKGATLDDILPEAFAVVREASIRVLGLRHFDVQLIGGMVLHQGRISEMRTGEGKTLTATLAAYLNALSGKGVHVVTVNDYLARRDCEWMSRLYNFLGLSTGVILHGISNAERRDSYNADITYGQNNEFGFDYLRDNMKLELSEKVQRDYHFAIVDEVDSILIDESRTPLIISGPSEDSPEVYGIADKLIRQLKTEEHYSVELRNKQVTLTEEGVRRCEQLLNVENLYEPGNIELVHHINQALKGHITMHRDFDYVVKDNQIIIVDEFTGRLMPGRRWSDGLHQAVEAKEGVKIQRENQTLATVTFQNFFRMYKKLSGMTGTADTEAVEFKKIYNLEVAVIPTNMDMIREDNADVVYATEKGKFKAVCDEIEELHEKGQPILVGTASIAKSEVISSLLEKRGIVHNVLNAKQHEREAEIIAQAGRFAAVTISTNMAGRGTDIVLGGNPEFLATSAAGTKDPEDEEFQNQLAYFKEICAEEKKKVVAAGGLHILGTERHESRRIDNQLRGRSGRQGDPGSSRFYISLEDELMRRFGGERIQQLMTRVGLTDEDSIAGSLVGRAIENAQKKVEGYHFDIRKHLIEYDDVMNKQRQIIYAERERILKGEDIEEKILEAIPDTIEQIILSRSSEKTTPKDWDVAGMFQELLRIFALDLPKEEFLKKQEESTKSLAQELFDLMKEETIKRYQQRAVHFGEERMVKLIRMVFLQGTDYFWKEHLANMDHLKEGIGLRGYGQKNPLHEYQKESYEMFASMLMAIKISVLQNIFIPDLPSEVEIQEIEDKEKELQRKREAAAQATHEEVLEAATSKDDKEEVDNSGLNRQQRRNLEKKSKRK